MQMLPDTNSPVVHGLLLDEEMLLQNDVLRVKDLNAFVKQVLQRLNVEPSLAKKLQLAVEEAVVNVIDYAYPEGETGDIIVHVSYDGQTLKFVIKDWGMAFDPTMKESLDISNTSVVDRPEGGLGILLVREMMDSISYERQDGTSGMQTDGMNVLTLKKELNKTMI